MAARHKGDASARGNQTNFTAICRLRRLRRRVGSTCLAGWRRHVLLWVLLLWSVVVVADIGSDVERLGVRAEAMADRTEELQFTVRSSVVSFDARLDADIVLDIAFFSGGVC